jgi:aquaporin TIP
MFAERMNINMAEFRSPQAIRAALAELIATALFVFIGVGAIAAMISTAPELGGGIVIIAAAHSLAIAVLVAGIGPISGGHINPAVTFATLITGHITPARGLFYIAAQLLGAVIGAALIDVLIVDELLDTIPGAGGHTLEGSIVASNLAAVVIEAIITFLLVWTVFATAVNPRNIGPQAGLFIGFAYFAIQLMAIPMTGGSANPARTFGPALVFNFWDDWWVYYAGPLIGAAIAAIAFTYLYLNPDDDAVDT